MLPYIVVIINGYLELQSVPYKDFELAHAKYAGYCSQYKSPVQDYKSLINNKINSYIKIIRTPNDLVYTYNG